jgi:hypothetical protein
MLENHGWERALAFAYHIVETQRMSRCEIGIDWNRVNRTIREEEERIERERLAEIARQQQIEYDRQWAAQHQY